LLIPEEDYKRISSTIYSLLLKTKIDKSCIYFGLIGAALLQEFYKVEAWLGCGSFVLCVKKDAMLAFGELDGDNLISTRKNFHAFTFTDDWAIDFMAPFYTDTESYALKGTRPSIDRKMFQKKLDDNGKDMDIVGSFNLGYDHDVLENVKESFLSHPFNMDLLVGAKTWYHKPPRKMPKYIAVDTLNNDISTINFVECEINGYW